MSASANRLRIFERRSGKGATDPPVHNVVLDGVFKILPTICILAFATWLVLKYDAMIRTRLRGFRAAGVELAFGDPDHNLDKLQNPDPKIPRISPGPPISGSAKQQVRNRVSFLNGVLNGGRILWVDDRPWNNVLERNYLQSLGISIDSVENNKAAYELLRLQGINGTPYDLVISDYDRDNESGESGFTLLDGMRKQGYNQDVVYYTASGQKKPDDAFALTNSASELFNYVFDVLERTSSANGRSAQQQDQSAQATDDRK